MRLLFALVAMPAVLLVSSTASADAVDDRVSELASGSTSKLRIAAALALTNTADPRALPALTAAMTSDSDESLRLVAVKAVGRRMASAKPSARKVALTALRATAKSDKNPKVRDEARDILTGTAGPGLLIVVDDASDQTKRGATAAVSATGVVRATIAKPGYATAWPGGLPSQAQLAVRGADAFIVATSITAVAITKREVGNEVTCTVQLRAAPWQGRDADGGEHWVADKSATATGSAKVTAAVGAKATELAVEDCVVAVAENLASTKIVPFLRRVAGKPSR